MPTIERVDYQLERGERLVGGCPISIRLLFGNLEVPDWRLWWLQQLFQDSHPRALTGGGDHPPPLSFYPESV